MVDWKLLDHIQGHCHIIQTMALPQVCSSWGLQTVLKTQNNTHLVYAAKQVTVVLYRLFPSYINFIQV